MIMVTYEMFLAIRRGFLNKYLKMKMIFLDKVTYFYLKNVDFPSKFHLVVLLIFLNKITDFHLKVLLIFKRPRDSNAEFSWQK